MAEEGRDSEPNPAPNRRISGSEGPCMFRGSGDATLTVYGFETWKDFLKRGDRPLNDEELERIVAAASCENFAVGGRISVEWPEVRVDFAMDHFIGRKKKKHPFIVSAKENFSAIMHPFAVNKEWCRGLGDRDRKKLEGYEWVFEQEKDFTEYKGHVRKGKEIFITFQFTPDWRYHYSH